MIVNSLFALFVTPFMFSVKLVTVKKVTSTGQYPVPTFDPVPLHDENIHIPAHKDFREKYFQGFKSSDI